MSAIASVAFNWFALALLSALFQVLRNMAMKRLGHALDETINVWGRFTFLLPFAGLSVLIRGVPTLGEDFWLWALGFGITQNLATRDRHGQSVVIGDVPLLSQANVTERSSSDCDFPCASRIFVISK